MNILILGLAAIVLNGAGAQTSAPLAPSAEWVVGYEKGSCVMSRRFGDSGDGGIAYSVRPGTFSTTATIALTVPARAVKRTAKIKDASIVLEPSGQAIKVSSAHQEDGGSGTFLAIDRDSLPALFAASKVTILTEDLTVSLAPTDGPVAIKALRACETELMARWKIDPIAVAEATTPGEFINPVTFLQVGDYPSESIQRRSQGMSVIFYKVGIDGRAYDCRVVQSSGDPLLDLATCAAMLRRGQFKPARNLKDMPVPSWRTQMVNWTIPK